MTKVQIRFNLEIRLDESQLAGLADAHKIYGMLRVVPAATLDGVAVEYDASRVSVKEVEAALRRAGIPISATA